MDTGDSQRFQEKNEADLVKRTALLTQAWQRLAKLDYPGLERLLIGIPDDVLVSEPELGFLLGVAYVRVGKFRLAVEVARRVRDSAIRRGNVRLSRELSNMEAAALMYCGRLDEAERLLAEVLDSSVQAEDEFHQGIAWTNLAIIADIRCNWAESLSYSQRAVSVMQKLGRGRESGMVHNNLSLTFRHLGLYSEAHTHAEHAFQLFSLHGNVEERWSSLVERALLLRETGDARLARSLTQQALDQLTTARLERFRGEAFRALGILDFDEGDLARSHSNLRTSLEIARNTDNALLEAEVLEELAVVEQANGREEKAVELVTESMRIYEWIGSPARAQRARQRLYPAEAGERSTA